MSKPINQPTSQPANYLPIVGMEIHAELKTKSKMFCGCKNDPFHAPKPNIYTCPVCLGMPGALPVANKTAIEWTIKLGLALSCEINLFSKFDRKNYFYPDLPKGYQISQYDIPFCVNGVIETDEGPVRIRRIHLEEDTGKLQHKTVAGKKVSLIDYNRSSVPLIEIVTEPDIHSARHAKEYAKKLRQIIRYIGISDADMEQGSMRLEANVSLLDINSLPTSGGERQAQPGKRGLDLKVSRSLIESNLPTYKVEVKNINSFTYLEKAISYEIDRHSEMLNRGETPKQETRGWDEDSNATFSQRSKEDAEDYRYFPDPDLPPLQFTKVQIEEIRKSIPELPAQIMERWSKDFSIEEKYASVLTDDKETADYANELFTKAKKDKLDANKLANMWVNKKMAIEVGKDVEKILSLFKSETEVASVDESELENIITEVMNENPDAVTNFKAGKEQVIGFLMGQVMRKLGKKVDAKAVQTAMRKQLTSSN